LKQKRKHVRCARCHRIAVENGRCREHATSRPEFDERMVEGLVKNGKYGIAYRQSKRERKFADIQDVIG
jgi:hypothetical protein